MGGLLRAIKSHLTKYKPLYRDLRFWSAICFILAIAATHDLLESLGFLNTLSMVYYIPTNLYWVPMIYISWTFGMVGSITAAVWVMLISIPDFMFWHQGAARLSEIFLMLVIVITAFIVGRLVDQKIAAQKKAKAFAAFSVRNLEEERRRLSQNIHDESIQTLISACHKLDNIKNSSPPVPGEYNKVRTIIEQAIMQLRTFTRSLRPPILDDLGMVTAVRRLLTDMAERTGIEQDFRLVGTEYRLPSDVELHLFRIAQEAIKNVELHADAKKVTLTISFVGKEIKLETIDDGTGFNLNSLQSNVGGPIHFGIVEMSERAEIIGGRLKINSEIGRGTRITVIIPVNRKTSMSEFPEEQKDTAFN